MLFNKHFIWPSFYYNDLLPMVELTNGSSLSVKASEDNEQAIYELKLPTGFDKKGIEATIEGDILRVVIPKKEPKEEVNDNKVKVKGA